MEAIDLRAILFMVLALACLGSGLYIYFKNAHRAGAFSATTANISMLLIAIFPVILLFSFDPKSSATGEYMGFTMGGAIAAFFVIWLFGTKRAINAQKIDELSDKVSLLSKQLNDAQILANEEGKPTKPQPLQKMTYFEYRLMGSKNKTLGIITGNLINVKGIDVWVNSENTNMQMARFYESSISGVIRYHGAKKDEFDEVSEDLIANELTEKLKGRRYVKPGVVITTNSGELRNSNGVQMIFHCASANGQVGAGYKSIEKVESCVTNSLKRMETENKTEKLRSIVFPIMGAGTGKGDPADIVDKLISTAIGYLKHTPESSVEKVYFLAFTDKDLVYCQRSFAGWAEEVESIK